MLEEEWSAYGFGPQSKKRKVGLVLGRIARFKEEPLLNAIWIGLPPLNSPFKTCWLHEQDLEPRTGG